ncbi:MAG: hypothetical protein KUG80_03560 [Gammaproteobacteria bacterium]|nr:hypothetical protein [Gammaproteobacteria bacterium]
MIYLIIFLVVLSIGASLINLLPSKSERMQAILRAEAISAGYSVKVVWPDSIEWLHESDFPSPLLQYTWPAKTDKQDCWRYERKPPADCIQASGENELVGVLAVGLGECFIALERTPSALVLYWLETDAIPLNEITEQLKAIACERSLVIP